MSYYFKHPEHTGGDACVIGEDETEALTTLQDEYNIELDDIVTLTLDGFVYQNYRLGV